MNKAERRFRQQIKRVNARSRAREGQAAYAISPGAFQAPRGVDQINTDADVASKFAYGGALGQNELQARQIPEWFNQYKATIMTAPQVAAQYQPAIEASQKNAAESGKALGLEGAAGEQDQLAAKAREALANLGTSVLTNAQQQDTTYYQGRQGVAQAAQIGALTQNSQNRQQLLSDQGLYRQNYVDQAREQERAYGLSREHQNVENKAFGVKQQQAAADASEPNQYGVPKDQWARWSASHRKRWIAKFNKDTAKPPAPKAPGEPKYGVDADKWAKMSPKERKDAKDAWEAGDGKGGSSDKDAYGNTRVQRRSNNNDWNSAKAWLKSVPDDLLDNPALAAKVGKETGADFDVAKIALFRRKNGYITPRMAKKLDRLGIRYSPGLVGKPQGPGAYRGGPEGTGQTTYSG